MFNSARLNSRLVAAALGALTIGAIAFSASAAAAPLPLFPFIMSPPVQSAPPPAALAPSDDEDAVTELPAEYSGVPQSRHDLLTERALNAQFGAAIEEIKEIEQAIEAAESSVEGARRSADRGEALRAVAATRHARWRRSHPRR